MSRTNPSIVISGAAVVSGLGLDAEQTWQNILHGACAMGPMSALESPLPPGKDGGQAMDLPADFAPHIPREVRYLQWTITHALGNAGIEVASFPYRPRRRACIVGTTLHGMRAAGRFLRGGDLAQLRDFLAGSVLAAALEGLGIGGLAASTCSACSSGLASIALGVTLLQSGQADLVISGGYDPISEYVWAGFNSLRLVADSPLRPFCKNRRGMKLAEGYGIVVLERSEDALARGVRPLAAILGWGESADAHHLTQPHPQGDGAARAIQQAMACAHLEPQHIDLIAAHGTATPDNDAGEFAAFSRVFGADLPRVPVVAFKSHLGHALGAAGAVELILAAHALRDQIVPACVNVSPQEVEFAGLSLATGQPRRATLRTTLNTSLGFGGANTCVILGPAPVPSAPRRAGADLIPAHQGDREVLITGIGAIFPGIVGNEALARRVEEGGVPAWQSDAGSVGDADLQGLLNARRVRRMSDYVKLTLATATLACRDAGIDHPAAFAKTCAAVLGSSHGSTNFSETYYRQIIQEGIAAANPALFAEAVPNAGAAQLSLMLGIQGACQSVIGTRTAGLDALLLAAARIRSGVWERALVGGAEEYSQLLTQAYRACAFGAVQGGPPFADSTGMVNGAGAVMFVLESQASLEQRGGRARADVQRACAAMGQPSHAAQSLRYVLEELGRPANVLSSACGTWIDAAEAAAMRGGGTRVVSAIYGHLAETFSASPLAGIAATVLRRKLPRLLGDAWTSADPAPAAGDQAVDDFAVLCTAPCGGVCGVRLSIL